MLLKQSIDMIAYEADYANSNDLKYYNVTWVPVRYDTNIAETIPKIIIGTRMFIPVKNGYRRHRN